MQATATRRWTARTTAPAFATTPRCCCRSSTPWLCHCRTHHGMATAASLPPLSPPSLSLPPPPVRTLLNPFAYPQYSKGCTNISSSATMASLYLFLCRPCLCRRLRCTPSTQSTAISPLALIWTRMSPIIAAVSIGKLSLITLNTYEAICCMVHSIFCLSLAIWKDGDL